MNTDENFLDSYVNDVKTAVRGAVVQVSGKTRVTMYLDNEVLQFFRLRAARNGRGYQTEINSCLVASMGSKTRSRHVKSGRHLAHCDHLVSVINQQASKLDSRDVRTHFYSMTALQEAHEDNTSDGLSDFVGSELSKALLASDFVARRA